MLSYESHGILSMIWLVLLIVPTVLAGLVETYLAVHNLSPYALVLNSGKGGIDANSLVWGPFPRIIGPGNVTEIHVAYQSSSSNYDAFTRYNVGDGSNGYIDIVLQGTSMYLVLDGLKLPSQRSTNTIQLGFESTGGMRTPLLIGGGYKGNPLTTQYLAPDWMQRNIKAIGCQPLRHLILPGSHDAGMSEFNAHTTLAADYDTKTQTMNIFKQLMAGIRYFDIRPVISSGHYWTGHYSKVEIVITSWQGGNGQSMADVISNINQFLDSYAELVILDISHSAQTDSDYSPFNAAEWSDFTNYMSSNLKHVFIDTTVGDLTQKPLSYFIGQGKAAVILIDSDGGHSPLNGNGGWYSKDTHFPYAGSYSDTISRDTMRADQMVKLYQNRKSADSTFFQMSWTLTTDVNPNGIISWAQGIYTDLFDAPDSTVQAGLLNGFSGVFGMTHPATYPNLVYIDAVPDNRLATLCLIMSQYYSSCQA